MDTGEQTTWSFIQDYPEVQAIYADPNYYFPKDVRGLFAAWIERQPWDQISNDDALQASELIGQLFGLLQSKVAALNQMRANVPHAKLQLTRILEINNQFLQLYGKQPVECVRVIKHCLSRERQILAAMQQQSADDPMVDARPSPSHARPGQDPIIAELVALDLRAAEEDTKLHQIENMQESFRVAYLSNEDLKNQVVDPGLRMQRDRQVHDNTVQLARQSEQLIAVRAALKTSFDSQRERLETLQGTMLGKLNDWIEHKWRWSARSEFLESQMTTIKACLRHLASSWWSLKQRLTKLLFLHNQLPPTHPAAGPTLEQLIQLVTEQFQNLIARSFVVTDQPPHILKKNIKFSMTVELLIGDALIIDKPTVTSSIINEQQAFAISSSGMLPQQSSGKLLNGTKRLEKDKKTQDLKVEFSNICVKEVTHSHGGTRVPEEKFGVLLTSRVTVGDQTMDLWVLTNPATVLVHGKQLCRAEATMFWDRNFGNFPRNGWAVPDRVFWNVLADALSRYVEHETGRPLSPIDLSYMREKLMASDNPDVVTWQTFIDQDLDGRPHDFTFWSWLYHIIILIQSSLSEFWKAGLISGFVPKAQVVQLLKDCPGGTFLLRFSDSVKGGVSVCYVDHARGSVAGPAASIVHLQPWVKPELQTISLTDRIRDTENLTLLYPKMQAKDTVFGQYYTPTNISPTLVSRGYVSTGIKMTVQESSSGTPLAFQMFDAMVGDDGSSGMLSVSAYASPFGADMPPTYGSPYQDESGGFQDEQMATLLSRTSVDDITDMVS